MKQLIVILCVLAGAGCSAQKAGDASPSIKGRWQVTECSGGFSGKGPGWNLENGVFFEFGSGKFRRLEKKAVRETDKYTVKKAHTIFSESEVYLIDFRKLPDLAVTMNGEEMILKENVNDGFSYTLRKVR